MNIFDNGTIRLFLVLLLFSVPSALIEYLICRFSKGGLTKYILPLITVFAGVGSIIYAKTSHLEGFLDIAYILLGMLFFGAFVASLIVLVVYEISLRRRKK